MSDLAATRARLVSARAATTARLAALVAEFDQIVEGSESVNTDDEHDPEGATIAFERAQVTALRDGAVHQLAALDAALERVESGTYGACSNCGGAIAAERLDALPDASTCVSCAGGGSGRTS